MNPYPNIEKTRVRIRTLTDRDKPPNDQNYGKKTIYLSSYNYIITLVNSYGENISIFEELWIWVFKLNPDPDPQHCIQGCSWADANEGRTDS